MAVVLGILGLVLAGAVTISVLRRRRPSVPAAAPEAGEAAPAFQDDDLPGFLERPPGSATATAGPRAGWTTLSSPPAPLAPAPTVRAVPRWSTRTITAAGVAALLLLGAAVSAVLAAADHGPAGGVPAAGTSDSDGRIVSADLTFGGIVLERHVVGVTATYPHVQLTKGGTVAHVELPTYNCLATEAPADPVAAHCARSVPEYADLPAPALTVSRSAGGQLRITGRFPTYTRPNGSPPVRTGQTYELQITAAPAAGRPEPGEVPATGELHLGDGRAMTTGVSVLHFGT